MNVPLQWINIKLKGKFCVQSASRATNKKRESSTSPFNLDSKLLRTQMHTMFDYSSWIKTDINSISQVGKKINLKAMILLDTAGECWVRAQQWRGIQTSRGQKVTLWSICHVLLSVLMCVCEYACVCTCIAHVFTVTSWGPKKGMETKRPCNDCIETCFKVKSRLSF